MKSVRLVLALQALYYLIMALWPIFHIESFMDVSGPKTDIWLVKTVAVLLLSIAIALLSGIILKTNFGPVIILAIASCIGFIIIDCYYVSAGVISRIYLVDTVLEMVLIGLYLAGMFSIIRNADSNSHKLPDDIIV